MARKTGYLAIPATVCRFLAAQQLKHLRLPFTLLYKPFSIFRNVQVSGSFITMAIRKSF